MRGVRVIQRRAALPWPLVISQILCLFFLNWRLDAVLRHELTAKRKKNTHARSHGKPCLICKAKPRVTPAVPAADCCPASLPPLLQAQTMTARHQENPHQHWHEVSSGTESHRCFSNMHSSQLFEITVILMLNRTVGPPDGRSLVLKVLYYEKIDFSK